ncbi:MAG: alpha-galactosidase, partial [Oscillospiraceae bacterium]
MDFYENLKLYPELKLRNDDHNNHFSNGLSMCGSMSTRDLTEVFSNDLEVKYKNSYGHTLIIHKKKFKDILEVYTTFENTGEAETIIEMISSCAISGIKADNIHRIQSFWSMEGRVKTESTNSLQLEPSWSEYAVRCEKFGNLGSMPIRKYFPFVAFSDARSENFIGVSLYSPSSWQFEILCQIEELSMSCGIADRDFGH